MLMAFIAIVVTLILVVGIHEAGHAIVARFFHVKIEHIAIGFGRPLLQWQSRSGIKWIWALWPLGGSVRLLNTRIAAVPKKLHAQCFDKQPVWIRVLILLAGVIANLILAWCALVLVFSNGIFQRPPVIQSVQEHSIASDAGLSAGDRIASVSGTQIDSWQGFARSVIIAMGSSKLKLTVLKSTGEVQQHSLNLRNWRIRPRDKSLLQSIGIQADMQVKKKLKVASSFWESIKEAGSTLWELMFFLMVMLVRIISGAIPFSLLLGPLGMLDATVYSFSQGVSVFALFVASFSLAVALINILPIPGLDGGSILYALIEKIRGKPISIAMEVLLYRLAVIVFAVLLFNLLMNDLQRFIARG